MGLQFEYIESPRTVITSGRRDEHVPLGTAEGTPEHVRLIYSTNGLFIVHGVAGHWVVPPTELLLLEPDLIYSIRKADSVSVRMIQLAAPVSKHLSAHSRLYALTPLLRELLETLRAGLSPVGNTDDSKALLLVDLLCDAGGQGNEKTSRCLALANDPRVAHICDYVYNNLDSAKTLQEWAAELDKDTRTLHRLFVQEFGMPFVQWRQQARLMAALEWLAEGRQVMDVALDLGYQTQSAFSAMFRRNMGITPSKWQEKQRAGAFRASRSIAGVR